MNSTPRRQLCLARRLTASADNLVSAPVLGLVKRFVGGGDQPFGQLFILANQILDGQHGQSNGYGQLDRLPTKRLQTLLGNAAANPFGNLLSMMQFGLG